MGTGEQWKAHPHAKYPIDERNRYWVESANAPASPYARSPPPDYGYRPLYRFGPPRSNRERDYDGTLIASRRPMNWNPGRQINPDSTPPHRASLDDRTPPVPPWFLPRSSLRGPTCLVPPESHLTMVTSLNRHPMMSFAEGGFPTRSGLAMLSSKTWSKGSTRVYFFQTQRDATDCHKHY